MISNYIKIAWRNLMRDKGFAFVNIFGLTIGMMAVTAIALWIQHELTFDRSYRHTDRLYQVFTSDEFQGETHACGGTAAILLQLLQKQYTEIDCSRLLAPIGHGQLIRRGKRTYNP